MLKQREISKFSSYFLRISLKLLKIFRFCFFLVKERQKIRRIYNIPKNIILNENITFNFVNNKNHLFPGVFFHISSKLHRILQFRLFFRERGLKILRNKLILFGINRFSLNNQYTFLSLSQIGFPM